MGSVLIYFYIRDMKKLIFLLIMVSLTVFGQTKKEKILFIGNSFTYYYNLPQVAEDYIHRIGRTARAGSSGNAICFVSPEEGHLWLNIDRLMNPDSKHHSSSRTNSKSSNKKFKNKKSSSRKKGVNVNFSDKPKKQSKFKSKEKKSKRKNATSSRKTIRSSDAKPKKRFYPAKKKK